MLNLKVFRETLNKAFPFMVRQALQPHSRRYAHERKQRLAVRPEPVEGLNQCFLSAFAIAQREKLCSWLSNRRSPANAGHRQTETGSSHRESEFQTMPGDDISELEHHTLTRLAANLPGFVYTLRRSPDKHFSFPFASEGIQALYGLQPIDVVDDMAPLLALTHPDDIPLINDAITSSALEMRPFRMRFRMQHPMHGEQWIESRATPEREAGGSMLWHGVMLDVTEQKRLEEKLDKSEREFRTLAESIPEPIIRYALDGRRLYVNPALLRISGHSAESLLACTPYEMQLAPPDDIRKLMDSFRRVQETGEVYEVEATHITADGRRIDAAVMMAPEFGPNGEVTSILSISRDITERKRLENALQRKREILTQAQRIGQMGSWELDLTSGELTWSDEVYRIFEIDPAAFGATYAAFLDAIHPDDREAVNKAYTDSLENRTSYAIDHRLLFADERIKHVRECCETHYDAEGKPVRSLGTVQDITERKKLELGHLTHLRFLESMDRINRAIQGADDLEQMMRDVLNEVLSIFDCDRTYLLYPCDPDSDTWQVPMQATRPEYPGVLPENVIVPMDESIRAPQRIVRASDGPVTFMPGGEHPLSATITERYGIRSVLTMAIYPKTGKPWQFGIHQCAYARIWTQEEIRLMNEIGRRFSDGLGSLLAYRKVQAQEREFRSLAESSPGMLGSFLWRTDGSICMPYASPNSWNLFGVHPEDLVDNATPILARSHPDDARHIIESIGESARTMTPWQEEYRILHPTRGERWMEGHANPEPHPSGGVILYGYLHDITERKQIEETARKNEAALYEAERIAQQQHYQAMLNTRLGQSQKLEAVGTMAAGIAHDFNNLLGSIIGFAEMAGDELPDGSFGKNSINQILAAGFHARDIVARMLTFARKNPVEAVAVEAVSQIREALVLLNVSFKPDVEIRFQTHIEEATMMADAGQLQQIVMNLCINAADAMNRRGLIEVWIDPVMLNDHYSDIKDGDADGGKAGICLTVADHGCGITPELQKRIFDPFFTTKAPNKGSGLGLSVVYGIVTHLGGVIEVESQTEGNNRGTRFRVFFPLATREQLILYYLSKLSSDEQQTPE
jgi:PAS domain S-box-containing protein